MKTLKTWGIYKMIGEAVNDGTIEELRNRRFKLIKGMEGMEGRGKQGEVFRIARFGKTPNPFYALSHGGIRADLCGQEIWEEVKEPVDFVTAIQSGKKIKPEKDLRDGTDSWGFSPAQFWLVEFAEFGGELSAKYQDYIAGKWLVDD